MSNGLPTESAAMPAFALNASRALSEAPTPAAERAKVAELSQQFEAMLMLQMVQQMRQSLLGRVRAAGRLRRRRPCRRPSTASSRGTWRSRAASGWARS